MINNSMIFSDNRWQFTGRRKLLVYNGEHLTEDLDHQMVSQFVKQKGALGAMWNYDYDCGQEGPWYEYICDVAGYDLDKIASKKTRYKIRHSLKSCSVRSIDYQWIAENAYPLYVKAASRYKDYTPKSITEFKEDVYRFIGVSNREAFGVFVGETLIAYAQVFICGQSLRLAASYFDPEYSKLYPMYVLYYTLAHKYLTEKGLKEINSGSRPLLHETNIGNFRLHLGWRKAYCRLGIYLPKSVRTVLICARVSQGIWKHILPNKYTRILESLLRAQHIAKITSKSQDLSR